MNAHHAHSNLLLRQIDTLVFLLLLNHFNRSLISVSWEKGGSEDAACGCKVSVYLHVTAYLTGTPDFQAAVHQFEG